MIKIPPYLKNGDTVGFVCPSGFMSFEKVIESINVFQEWGYKVKIGTTIGGNSKNYFSGTDEKRFFDLQKMLDDDSVKAIFFARGGYGLSRIIDKLDFTKFQEVPKWVIGFSDITILHSHILSKYKIATLHAPMAAAFSNGQHENEFVLSLRKALRGDEINYKTAAHDFNKKGEVVGELVGGNLALLTHLLGTPSDFDTKGKILFLEDVGEYLYNIDRMLLQLKRSNKLKDLAALIIGGFTDCKDTERPFGKTVYEIINDVVKEYDYPVCFDFSVSHTTKNYALKIGVKYKLKVEESVSFVEIRS